MDHYNMRPTDAQGPMDGRRQSHQHTTRYSGHSWDAQSNASSHGAGHHRPARESTGSAAGSGYARPSPTKKEQKHVVFQLIDPEDPRIQARLPMRVMISPHDTTDSIITTVKNFYGLYEYGVSFENRDGISIIAAFDNFENDMVVYVRTVAQPPSAHNERSYTTSPSKPTLGAPIEMRASHNGNVHSPSRSAARTAMRSRSPHSEYARRSVSAAPARGVRAKSKSKDNSVHDDDADGYSSDDGANGSVTSSRRSRTEQVNAEISVNNIVEGGRRQRAFESSELPLFVPPQVPMTASISSVSPQRRNGPAVTPYAAYPNQQTFSYTQPLPSPQSHGSAHYQQNGMPAMGYGAYAQPPRQPRGARPSSNVLPRPRLSGEGVLPTPDPTVNSVISDEDVALQLMRLGDASNFSHGRTSTSTLDDALSGKAEAPSSDEEDDDAEGETSALPAVPSWPKSEAGPQRKKQRMHEPGSDGTTGDEYEDHRDGSFKGDSDEVMPDHDRRQSKPAVPRPRSTMPAALKSAKPRTSSMVKPKTKPFGHVHTHTHSHSHSHSHSQAKVPMSPASLPSQSRKTSAASTINFQHALGTDEEDLSSKPRCQRCRKSKKGCDRQRPCGRCKDAGIGIEGCISEDEGNGRKGRYGRHMGVPVKRGEEGFIEPDGSVPPMSIASAGSGGGGGQGMPNGGYFLAPAPVDKSKKRKR